MKRNRYTEPQIVFAFKQAESGTAAVDLAAPASRQAMPG